MMSEMFHLGCRESGQTLEWRLQISMQGTCTENKAHMLTLCNMMLWCPCSSSGPGLGM
jgi:hypothetical protein